MSSNIQFTSRSLEVAWSAEVVEAESTLAVTLAVRNLSFLDVFLFDGLWTVGPGGRFEPDPQEIYRFLVRGNRLRLFLGICPLPTDRGTLVKNVPFATQLWPEKSLERRFSIPLPVREHGCYGGLGALEAEDAGECDLCLQFVHGQYVRQVRPGPLGDGRVDIEGGSGEQRAKAWLCDPITLEVPVVLGPEWVTRPVTF